MTEGREARGAQARLEPAGLCKLVKLWQSKAVSLRPPPPLPRPLAPAIVLLQRLVLGVIHEVKLNPLTMDTFRKVGPILFSHL